MKSVVRSAVAVVAVLLWLSSASIAQDLPAFSVTAPNGAKTDIAAMPGAGQWILAYVFPGSAPSDALVESLGQSWDGAHAAKTVFVVFGTADAARAYLLKKGGPTLAADARWYADEQGTAWKTLRFSGTLAVAGMNGASLDWKMDGVIRDVSVVLPAIGKWLGGR